MRIFPTFAPIEAACAPIKAACLVVLSTTAWAAEHDSVGTFDFPTSGSPQAQEHFELGVGYLHSFGFEINTALRLSLVFPSRISEYFPIYVLSLRS